MWLDVVDVVCHPSDHFLSFCGVYVTHKSVELVVVSLFPLCEPFGKSLYWSKEIESRHPGCVEYFHQYTGCGIRQLPTYFIIARGNYFPVAQGNYFPGWLASGNYFP